MHGDRVCGLFTLIPNLSLSNSNRLGAGEWSDGRSVEDDSRTINEIYRLRIIRALALCAMVMLMMMMKCCCACVYINDRNNNPKYTHSIK